MAEQRRDVPDVSGERKMNIEIGKFIISSDSNCFTLYERKTRGKQSKIEGEEYQDLIGYYTHLEHVLDAIPTKALLQSDCNSLAEVKTIIEKYRGMIAESFKGKYVLTTA